MAYERERKGERVRSERIFGKKDSVGTWGESARVGFREEETVRACLRMIINGGREGERKVTSTDRGVKRSSQIFTVSGRNGVSR